MSKIICLVGSDRQRCLQPHTTVITSETECHNNHDLPLILIDNIKLKNKLLPEFQTKSGLIYIYSDKCKTLAVAMVKYPFCSEYIYDNTRYKPPKIETSLIEFNEKEVITLETLSKYKQDWLNFMKIVLSSYIGNLIYASNCNYKFSIGLRIDGIGLVHEHKLKSKTERVEFYITNRYYTMGMIDISNFIISNPNCEYVFYIAKVISKIPPPHSLPSSNKDTMINQKKFLSNIT